MAEEELTELRLLIAKLELLLPGIDELFADVLAGGLELPPPEPPPQATNRHIIKQRNGAVNLLRTNKEAFISHHPQC